MRAGLSRINHRALLPHAPDRPVADRFPPPAALKNADNLIGEFLTAVDTSRDGLIQYSEFKMFFARVEKELWRIFQSVDLNGNGKIDLNELKSALSAAGIAVNPPERLDEFFHSMDRNNDGGKVHQKSALELWDR